jgi:hypothetical protein
MKKLQQQLKQSSIAISSFIAGIALFAGISFSYAALNNKSPGDALTASEWNELVNRGKWVDATSGSGDFDLNCEYRWKFLDVVATGNDHWFYATLVKKYKIYGSLTWHGKGEGGGANDHNGVQGMLHWVAKNNHGVGYLISIQPDTYNDDYEFDLSGCNNCTRQITLQKKCL